MLREVPWKLLLQLLVRRHLLKRLSSGCRRALQVRIYSCSCDQVPTATQRFVAAYPEMLDKLVLPILAECISNFMQLKLVCCSLILGCMHVIYIYILSEHVAEAAQKVADAMSAAEQAQQLLSKAEARAESAEEAKIELSLKLAELAALQESAADVSGMPSKRATDTETESDTLQKR